MTTRYTNDEWATIIGEVEKEIAVSQEPYPCPDIGSPAFAKTIDHSLLKLVAKAVQFDDLCAEARVDGFATVCVRPHVVSKCVSDLKGTDIKVACVIGFHEGDMDLLSKMQETSEALHAGASELDIVMNYLELKAGDYSAVYNELISLRQQAPHPVLLKLIIETSQLDRSQNIAACTMAAAANFDFVKTSTGFNGQGATVENVRLMAACCRRLAVGYNSRQMQVKASGGIKTIEEAVAMLEAGASRLGTSAGVWIVKEGKECAKRSVSPPTVHDRRPSLSTRLFTSY